MDRAAWLGAVALVAVGVVGIVWFVVAGRRRSTFDWDHELSRQAADARWFADDLAPAVADPQRGASDAAAAWRRNIAAVLSTERVLERLADTAADPQRAATAEKLALASSDLRDAIDAHLRLRLGEAPPHPGRSDEQALADSAATVTARRTVLHDDLAAIPLPPIAPSR